MLSRSEGRKFKTHTLVVEGAPAEIQVRVTFDGEFFADWDGERHKARSYKDLIDELEPKVRESRRRVFVPVIYMEQSGSEHEDGYSRLDGETQEVGVRALVAWRSETARAVERSWSDPVKLYQYIEGEVDGRTGEMVPLTEDERRGRGRFSNTADPGVPFTRERWARILALREAIVRVRGALKAVLEDDTGASLDALGPGLPMLPEAEVKKTKRRSR